MRKNRNQVSPRMCASSPKLMPRTSSPYRPSSSLRKSAAPYATEATIPIRPTMLNQPVIQLQPLPPRSCAHQYGPPAVGYFEVSSAIESPTMITKKQITGQPIDAIAGPPCSQANENVVNVPASTEMIVNEIAKLVNATSSRA